MLLEFKITTFVNIFMYKYYFKVVKNLIDKDEVIKVIKVVCHICFIYFKSFGRFYP